MTEHVEDVWLKLNQNRFVQYNYVKLVHLWLKSLTRSGHKFVAVQQTVTLSIVPYSTRKSDGILDESTLAKLFSRRTKKVMLYSEYYDDEVCHVDLHRDSFTIWMSDIHFASQLDQPSFLGT